jgi:hypothetical protein
MFTCSYENQPKVLPSTTATYTAQLPPTIESQIYGLLKSEKTKKKKASFFKLNMPHKTGSFINKFLIWNIQNCLKQSKIQFQDDVQLTVPLFWMFH